MLIGWAVFATFTTIILCIIFLIYRRQVQENCRQLAFLHKNKTNLRLTGSPPFRELNELVDNINLLLDDIADRERENLRSETILRESITNLSHDIRTPLTSMSGYFDLLVQSASDEEKEHYIQIIKSRLGSLESMLEELFIYARLQDQNYRIELTMVDFGKCVFDLVFSYYEEFESKGIVPQIDFCEEQCFIQGNEEALHRVLQNMIKNGLVHGVGNIRFCLKQEAGWAIFICANTVQKGIHIDVNQIFKRFYKIDEARSQTSSGLGLSIAKGLTERMQGEISARLDGNWFEITARFPISFSL